MAPKDDARVVVELRPEELRVLVGLECPGPISGKAGTLPKDISYRSESDAFTFAIGSLQIRSCKQSRRQLVLNVLRDPQSGAIKEAAVQGVVRHCHVFRELFDYQTECVAEQELTQLLDNSGNSLDSSLLSRVIELFTSDSESLKSMSVAPFVLAPSALPFSAKDFKTATAQSSKRIGRPRKPRAKIANWSAVFEQAEVPQVPSEESRSRAKCVPVSQIEAIQALFAERPIISKTFIKSRITDSAILTNLRLILPLLAYHWQTGPWHMLWCRYGVDPRKDPKCRFYQSIELRNKMFAREVQPTRARGSRSASPKPTVPREEPTYLEFDGERISLKQLAYQYCDLTYVPLMEAVHSTKGLRSKCSEDEGWYPDGTTKKLRETMKSRWFALLKTTNLSSLPADRLDEVLEMIAPTDQSGLASVSSLVSMGGIRQPSATTETQHPLRESDAEDDEELSEYEIFDF